MPVTLSVLLIWLVLVDWSMLVEGRCTDTLPRKSRENHLDRLAFMQLAQHLLHEHGLPNPGSMALLTLFGS